MTRRKVIGGIILGVAVLSLLAVILVRAGGPDGSPRGSAGYTGNGPVVGVIEIQGMIAGDRSAAGLLAEGSTGSRTIMEQLRQASKDPNIKAVILRINSPGGTAAASQEIADEVRRLKESGVKVVTSMGDTAASGAYWIAAVSDKIVANPGTITGSIGVLMETTNYQELLNKLGISADTFKSGEYKDMGSPSRPMTPAEQEIFQSMVDDTYLQFVETVAGSRNLSPDLIRGLKGRVMTGRQARELGLVDRLGNYYDSVSLAGEISGLGKNPRVVDLTPKKQWWQAFEEMTGSIKGAELSPSGLPRYPGVLLLCPPLGK